jgi:hypothetical protein
VFFAGRPPKKESSESIPVIRRQGNANTAFNQEKPNSNSHARRLKIEHKYIRISREEMPANFLRIVLAADIFTFKANVFPNREGAQLLHFRSVEWLTAEHKNYCFRLINQTPSSIRGETFTATRKQVHKWLASGVPPEYAKSYLECTMVSKLIDLESIRTDNAFRELRAAILKRGESLNISSVHIQEWLGSGNMPEAMKSSLRTELGCSMKMFDAIFRELRKEIMRVADE